MIKFRQPLREVLLSNGVNVMEIPERWRDDPLLADRVYYVLPRNLLDCVLANVGRERFDSRIIEREHELADSLGDYRSNVNIGYWNGQPITYDYLSLRQPMELGQLPELLGKNDAEVSFIQEKAEARSRTFGDPLRAYVGWLLSNHTFREEHDRLLEQYWPGIRTQSRFESIWEKHDSSVDDANAQRQTDFSEFYSRWRLQKLAAPGLPIPLAPQVPDTWNLTGTSPTEGVSIITLPDICPVPGQGNVVEALEDSVRGGNLPSHLADWLDIASRENAAKNKLPAYERRFCLQHYWRVLQHRFPEALARKKTALRRAFAAYLNMSEDSVKGDLRFLTQHLGADWDHPSRFFC